MVFRPVFSSFTSRQFTLLIMKKQPEINPVWDKEIEKALQAIRENKWKITQNRLDVLKRLSK